MSESLNTPEPTKGNEGGQPSFESRAIVMRAVVKKYTSPVFPVHAGQGNAVTGGDVVLVTGTTGSIGSYLLAELVRNPKVSRIYAVNRPSSGDATTGLVGRHEKSLLEKGLVPGDILASDKVRLVEADLSVSGFGVSESLYNEMRTSTTHIIHNAWPGDLSMPLDGFEPCFQGLRNLIDFILLSPCSSPPSLVFVSSLGVFQNVKYVQTPTLSESPILPEVSAGNGYTESKWIAEEIIQYASNHTKLVSVIVRVGQVCGGGPNGCWNTTEWFPAIVQSGPTLGCIPSDDRNSSLVPVDVTAKALIEYRAANSPKSTTIVHLVHPNPTPFSNLAALLAEELSVKLVSFSEWLEKLDQVAKEKTTSASNYISAINILFVFHYLDGKFQDGADAFGFHHFDCHEGVRLSETLANAPQLGKENVEAWLRYWKNIGFIGGVEV